VVSFQAQDDTLTYERYFGLNEKPFSLNADPRFIYDSPAYAETSTALLASIRRREGLHVLTGEIGTGKTTLCRAVLRDLGRKTYSSLMPDPFASREDLLKMLLIDFGVLSIRELTAGPLRGASRTELGYLLSEFLDSLTPDAFVVVIIDEAQNLSLPLIEETRILSDTFGTKGRLQLVFVGQPELHAKLKLPEMRQVDQRVCGYHRLGPLSRDAVAGYILHRLQAAGGHRDRMLFPPAVVDALHQRSGGVPRLINRVCDRALHLAYARQAQHVDRETLDAALIEIGSTTLLPTWDSIVFAESPTSLPPTPAAPEPAAALVAHGVVLPPPFERELASPIDHDEEFRSEIADWVEQDLAPPSRTPSPLKSGDNAPALTRRTARKVAPNQATTYTVKTDWPRDLRSETYIQRLRRVWGKRVATAVAIVAGLNVAMVGGSLLLGSVTAPAPPAPPEAPARAVPGIALPEMPLDDAPAPVAPVAPTGASGEYLVAVGLFATRERADQLVDALTAAGLPAMQRSLQLRQQEMQQIVLGPFLSRSDAVADLRRLQSLGGYDDARVVTSSR
jgi:type II secretory pathway predicted ATPase ExeA/cell division septation protein DedD